MQCKPGVAFISKPMTKSDEHPLSRGGASLARDLSYRFYALSRHRAEIINQPNPFKGENNEA
jgi:hypothetical protein